MQRFLGVLRHGRGPIGDESSGRALGASERTAGHEPRANDVLRVRELDLSCHVSAGGETRDRCRSDWSPERRELVARRRRLKRRLGDEQRHEHGSGAEAARRARLASRGAPRCLAPPSQLAPHVVISPLRDKNFLHR